MNNKYRILAVRAAAKFVSEHEDVTYFSFDEYQGDFIFTLGVGDERFKFTSTTEVLRQVHDAEWYICSCCDLAYERLTDVEDYTDD